MSEESSGRSEPPEQALAQDWITIWHSELAALAADQEAQETWQKLVALWGEVAWTMLGAVAGGPPAAGSERADGSAGTVAPPRPPAAAAALGARDGEIARLGARLDALEQRLAELERGRTARIAGKRGGKRHP